MPREPDTPAPPGNPSTHPRLSVVVPFFNEEECAADSIAEIIGETEPWAGDSFEIIAVDDGSTDATKAVLQQATTRYTQLRVFSLNPHGGQSAALFWGVQQANGEHIALIDGDRQNHPGDIPLLLQELERSQLDLAVGWRKQRQDRRIKKIASRIANTVRRFLLRDGVHDTGCALKLFPRRHVPVLIPFRGMHRYIPALFQANGLKTGEIEVRHRAREKGASKYGINDRLWRGLYDLVGVRWLKRRVILARPREIPPS